MHTQDGSCAWRCGQRRSVRFTTLGAVPHPGHAERYRQGVKRQTDPDPWDTGRSGGSAGAEPMAIEAAPIAALTVALWLSARPERHVEAREFHKLAREPEWAGVGRMHHAPSGHRGRLRRRDRRRPVP
ncbi:MAG: hypothetical protein ACLSHC_18595 [Bilophila wadsworthia]